MLIESPTEQEARFLKLLEEYLTQIRERVPKFRVETEGLPGFTVMGIHESIIISKRFGFVNRLYEKDELDRDAIHCRASLYRADVFPEYDAEIYFERLLMMLQVAIRPIDVLVSFISKT